VLTISTSPLEIIFKKKTIFLTLIQFKNINLNLKNYLKKKHSHTIFFIYIIINFIKNITTWAIAIIKKTKKISLRIFKRKIDKTEQNHIRTKTNVLLI